MPKQVTRRKFLRQSGAGSLVALTASSQFSPLSVGQIWEEVEKTGAVQPASALSDAHRKLLRAAADEIIPAADGALAAAQAGATDYIETLLGKV
ncbi:MAG: twin-arginine translocation signal domain-containing protein, partial [Acidobacteria bacterium]|nr:twin-arginine translocation signal domain-containing protein [Acidobacteriota bacterium]